MDTNSDFVPFRASRNFTGSESCSPRTSVSDVAKKISLADAADDPLRTSIPILHHLCATKARCCWGFWNRGYPIVRVLDHHPQDNDYIIAVDMPDDSPLYRVDAEPSGTGGYAPPSPTELAIFLIDLYRLELNNLAGEFDLAILERTISFGSCEYVANEFVLVPSLRDIAKTGKLEKTNTLAMAKLAASIALPEHPNKFNRFTSIPAILKKINDIRLHIKKGVSGSGHLVFKIEPNETRLYAEHSDKRYCVYPIPHGSLATPIVKQSGESDKEIRIPVTFDPDGADKTPWVDALLRWENRCAIWQDGEQSNLGRNLLGTLCAEEHYADRYTVGYELLTTGGKSRKRSLKICPRDKQTHINGEDLYDACVDAGDMTVRLIDNEDKGESLTCRLDAFDDTDKFKITVEAVDGSAFPPPASGQLQPINAGNESLRKRKKYLMAHGITSRILYAHLNNQTVHAGWDGGESQLQIRHSLQTLQGPPGTGKTWTATRVIEDILARNPCARILVCAKEHHALDHLAFKIHEAVSGDGYHVARIRSNSGNNTVTVDTAPELAKIGEQIADELSATLPAQAAATLNEEKRNEGMLAGWVEYLAMKTASVVCTTTLDRMVWEFAKQGEHFDFAIVEEAGKCYPSELVGPLSLAMNTLLIGDHMQLPPFELREILNSIAPAVAVGFDAYEHKDRKHIGNQLLNLTIPFWGKEKFENDYKPELLDNIGKWLQPFAHMHDTVDCIPGNRLKKQYRMFGELSDLIGRLFYGEQFEMQRNDGDESDTKLPELFRRHGRLLFINHPHCTDDGGKKEIKVAGSLLNHQEADCARALLRNLRGADVDAVVITPYQAQVDIIKKGLSALAQERVHTVDGFQGKEADFVILSLVRNNDRNDVSRRWGFVRDPRRLNVALSRAHKGLAVISSARHIELTPWNEDDEHRDDYLNQLLDAMDEMGRVITPHDARCATSGGESQ